MNLDSILATIHNTPTRTRRAAAVAAAATFVVAGSFAGNLTTAHSSTANSREDWPRCVLVTELAAQTVTRRGHSLVFREVKGQNHGRMFFDGHYVGLGANLRAQWMACATRRILAPFDGVPRY